MRPVYLLIALTAPVLFPALTEAAAPSITAPEKVHTVGRNLTIPVSLKLSEPAPEQGVEITVTSDDPQRLLLGPNPHAEPAPSIKIKVGMYYFESPDFYVFALDDKGTATYTASAPGFTGCKGTVNLGKSAVLIVAPLRAPILWTTPATTQRVGFETVLLDNAGKVVEKQLIGGGRELKIEPVLSNPAIGRFDPPVIVIPPGECVVGADFKPAGVGTGILSVKPPPGFSVPAEFASVNARIELPGIGIAGEVMIGKDLQIPATILLGQPAPDGTGLDVTLSSSDPKRLVFSTGEKELGTGVLKVHIGPGLSRADYYLQSLGSEGTVNYVATAPGYRNRVAPVHLAPSGIMVAYSANGAADEAEYKSKVRVPRPVITSLSSKIPSHVAVWTVYLDPVTRRGADMTAQKLRPGVSVEVELKSSDPSVGTVPGKIKLDGSSEFYIAEFKPLRPGQTVLSVNTPPGFLTPSNATSVTATVKE